MIKVHSLSGGKTSSYMAVHYPADYNVFSLVTIDDHNCMPSKDLVKKVSDKLNKEFIATAEDDRTLIAMFDLEQKLGKEIIWLSGKSFDNVIKKATILPNKMRRFCTTEMKLRPIWDWWYHNVRQVIQMGIGFRYDEKERAERFKSSFKGIIGKHNDNRNKWEEIEWRQGWFPLIDDKIGHYTVYKWSQKSGIDFPADSNCVGCFWKPVQQLRKNWDDNSNKMQWFANQEGKSHWKEEITYNQIKKVGLQQDFFFGTGSGCQAGYCTD